MAALHHTDTGTVLSGLDGLSDPSLLFAASATGIESRRRRARGPALSTQGRIHAFLAAAAVVLLAIAIVSFASINALRERAQWVEHTYQVRAQFEQLMEQYLRARVAWRSVLIANRESQLSDSLRDFEAAREQLPRELDAIRQLTADNAGQQEHLASVARLMRADLGRFADDVQARRDGRLSASELVLAYSDPDRFNIAEIERTGRAFRDEEGALLDTRTRDSRISSRNLVLVIVLGNVGGFLILFYAFALLRRENAARTRLESALQRANQELETKVGARTHELADANVQLATLNATLERRIALRTAELEDLYNNAPCGYHSTDANNLITKMNDTELGWLGYARNEVVGRLQLSDLHTPESLRRHASLIAIFKETGVLQDAEADFVRKDGSVLHVSLSATAIRDGQGNFIRSRTSVYDISERKRTREEIMKLNATLEARARELSVSNEELESFAYSVSHDLRTPLRAIDGYSLMLEEDHRATLDGEGRRLLAVIRDNSRKMGALIDSLLALSRLGRQHMTAAAVPMLPLVREVVGELLPAAGRRPPAIEIGPLPAAQCDRALVRQVWLNLIGNAIKYTGRTAQPCIAIGGRREGGMVVFRVADNGAGFDMQYVHKLFGVFQRLHRAEDFAGSGVGLAIVQRIVHRHGGTVKGEGIPGAGATFEFSLPAGDER